MILELQHCSDAKIIFIETLFKNIPKSTVQLLLTLRQ